VIKLNVNFRLREGVDKDLIKHIREVQNKYNTNNRSEVMRMIIERSLKQDNLIKRIEEIENNQLKLLNYVDNLKDVSDKTTKNLNSLMKGLYGVFNQGFDGFEEQKSNPFDIENNEDLEEDETENEEEYNDLINNVVNNPNI